MSVDTFSINAPEVVVEQIGLESVTKALEHKSGIISEIEIPKSRTTIYKANKLQTRIGDQYLKVIQYTCRTIFEEEEEKKRASICGLFIMFSSQLDQTTFAITLK